MKFKPNHSLLALLSVSFLFAGCYTQFSTVDRYSLADERRGTGSDYYAWDGTEEAEEGYNWSDESQTAKAYTPPVEEEEQGQGEEIEIYFKDTEKEQWYKDNYLVGYEQGYGDGYEDGYSDRNDYDTVLEYYYHNNPQAYEHFTRNYYAFWRATRFFRFGRGSLLVNNGFYSNDLLAWNYYNWFNNFWGVGAGVYDFNAFYYGF